MAFASKWIRDPQDIYTADIPDCLQSVPIEWAKNWKNVPLLLHSVRDSTGKVYTSPKLAWRSLGMKESALITDPNFLQDFYFCDLNGPSAVAHLLHQIIRLDPLRRTRGH